MGCPLDAICNMGMGASCMSKPGRLRDSLRGLARAAPNVPITLKMRTGLDRDESARFAHKLVEKVRLWNAMDSAAGSLPTPLVSALALHGRTRQQRYAKLADWEYIGLSARTAAAPLSLPATLLAQENVSPSVVAGWKEVGQVAADGSLVLPPEVAPPLPFIGNGDVLHWQEWHARRAASSASTIMLARGVLIKPWLVREIKQQADWDISSGERLDILKDFVACGLEHWGSDQVGVNRCRRFLLEWLSFLHRYVPLGVMERATPPQRMNQRVPAFVGRNELETLMGSSHAEDWVRISELLLGKVAADFRFLPKHKTTSYEGDSGARIAITADAMGGDQAEG